MRVQGGTKSHFAVAFGGENQGNLPKRNIGAQSSGKEEALAWRSSWAGGAGTVFQAEGSALSVLEAKVSWCVMEQWGQKRLSGEQGSHNEGPLSHFGFTVSEDKGGGAIEGLEAAERQGHVDILKQFWLMCEEWTEGDPDRKLGHKC